MIDGLFNMLYTYANVSYTVSNAEGDKIKLNYSVFGLSRDN